MNGKPVHFDAEKQTEKQRTVPAEWVAQALREGHRVELANAILAGPLDLQSVHVKQEFILFGCEVRGPVNASYARFARLVVFQDVHVLDSLTFMGAHLAAELNCTGTHFIKNTSFEDATIEGSLIAARAEFGSSKDNLSNFNGCEIRRAADFTLAVFHSPTHFINLTIGKLANFCGAQFKQGAAFDGAKIGGRFFFGPEGEQSAKFYGEASFYEIKVGSTAEFTGAQFKQLAAFDRAEITGNFFFRSTQKQRMKFGGEARFLGITVGGQTAFNGAQFKQLAAFDGAEIGGTLFFCPEGEHRVEFDGEVRFHGNKVGGNAEFDGAKFKQMVAFDGAEIGGDFFFRPAGEHRVEFGGEARFQGIKVGSNAEFDETRFKQEVSFQGAMFAGAPFFRMVEFSAPVSFTASRFRLAAEFQDTHFEGPADFRYARFEQEVHFAGAEFHDRLNLRDARMTTLSFEDGGKTASFDDKTRVDLLGCAYDRLEISNWRELMNRQSEINLHPWSHLEKVLRAAGHKTEANEVYYDRRERESRRIRFLDRPNRWLVDRFERHTAGYGIRTGLVILYLFNIILFGSLVFNWPGALIPVGDASVTYPLRTTDIGSMLWNWFSALGHSVRYLFPIDIPLHRQWQPAYGFFSLYASVHMLMGVVFITTAFATVTGLLRRAHPD